MKTISLKIGGMTCTACSSGLERLLSKTEGVKKATASFAAESAIITYDENITDIAKIEKVINSLGFKIVNKTREERMADEKREQKKRLVSVVLMIALTLPLFFLAMSHMWGFALLENSVSRHTSTVLTALLQLILCVPVIALGFRFYKVGFPAFFKGAANMDSLIAIGTSVAFVYSLYAVVRIFTGDDSMISSLYFETSAMVITLVSLGKLLESRARKKSSASVEKLLMLSPQNGIVLRDGKELLLPIEQIFKDDIVVVKTGGKLPVDGEVIEGEGSVDESMLTGESIPVMKQTGSEVCGGSICTSGYFKYVAKKVGSETVISNIIRMVENARMSKAPIARLADVISGYFAYIVSGIALFSAIVWLIATGDIQRAISVFVSVMVVSCPCALGLATPCSIMSGTGFAAENGILFKDAVALEALSKVNTFIFDKTGTLTEGRPSVTAVALADNTDAELCLSLSLTAEQGSVHPLSEAIKSYAQKNGAGVKDASEYKTFGGEGVSCVCEGKAILCGNAKLLERYNVDASAFADDADKFSADGMSLVYLAQDNTALALFGIKDTIKGDAKECVESLRNNHAEVIMLTGDNTATANVTAKELAIDRVIAEVKPDGKAQVVDRLKKENRICAMIGDGINDAVALANAHVGIALARGADVASESADVIILHDGISQIASAHHISKSVMKNIRQNLFFAFVYNAVGIPLAAGILYPVLSIMLPPMFGAIAMSLSSVTVVLNSIRAGKK